MHVHITNLYIKAFHTTGVEDLMCWGIYTYFSNENWNKIRINFPPILIIMKLPSWFGFSVPILIIISQN